MSLTLTDVSRSYKADGEPVISNINLEINDGEFICIVGPSGCGKSTLINLLTGLDRADAGNISLDGHTVSEPGADRALVFQDGALFPWLSVSENVMFALAPSHLSRAERLARTEKYLKLVNMLDYRDYAIHELSGGMRQRVSIARALALESKVLLMDEPFSALDAQTKTKLQSELLTIWRETGRTIVFITHDITEAVRLADRIVVMGYAPESIKAIIPVELPRPRENTDELERRILSLID